MTQITKILAGLLALAVAGGAVAAGADLGETTKQATNWIAIAMFAVFVGGTLFITKWAASKTKSAADFYTQTRTVYVEGLPARGPFDR